MDTTKTHYKNLIVGQKWAEKGKFDSYFYPTRVERITDKYVTISYEPKLLPCRKIPIDEFFREWTMIQDVELKPFINNHGKFKVQIFVNDHGHKYVFREMKL